MDFWRVADDAVVAFTFCWIVSVIFGTVRRFLISRSQTVVQQKIFERIDTSQALIDLAANESGRHFLESLTIGRAEPASPLSRILYGIQAGIVLIFLGIALLFLHRHIQDDHSGFIIFGTGAIGLGFGFTIAAAVSTWFSRAYGILTAPGHHDHRG